MNIAGFFIRRAVTTTLLMFAILLVGILGYELIPVSNLPNVDFPVINVSASFPGASPDNMASSVATPLERQFSTIDGLNTMTSTSSLGSTQITLQFDLERDIDAAAQDVQTAITQARAFLPQDLPQPPTYEKVNPADQPILYVSVTSETLPLWVLDEYADTRMAQRISMVKGVAQVQLFGPQKYAVRVQLNPSELASRDIGFDDVRNAISNENVNLPTGTLFGERKAYTVQSEGQLYDASAYKPLIVTYRNGSPVRLDELGRVIDSVENDKTAAWYVNKHGMHRTIVLAIRKQPGTNAVEVAQSVKKLISTIQLPPSIKLHTLYDRSASTLESINEVKFTMILTLILVIGVIFVFLRNFSATIIPSLALPMSIMGTFAVIYLLNYSINNLTLMAIILAIAFVIDDAIVMFENIVRHMEMGKKPYRAALDGSKEIGFTILSMTLSLAAVFLPVLFMGGVIGKLFREFGMTIFISILISGLVSLTLTPMLCSRFLRPGSEMKHGKFYNFVEKVLNGMRELYKHTLLWVLEHRKTTLFISFVMLIATAYLFMIVPKGFLPNEDQGTILTFTQAEQGTSYNEMVYLQKKLMNIIQKTPEIEEFYSSVGGGNLTSGLNQGIMFLHLKHERKKSTEQVIQDLRPKISKVPGIMAFMQDPPEIRLGGQLTKGQYQFTLQSQNTDLLYSNSEKLEQELKKIPELQDVTSDLQIKNPEVELHIDRDKASTLGVTAREIEQTLFNAYGSRWISTIFTSTDQYKVIMEVAPEYQEDPDVLSKLYVHSTTGNLVKLDSVTKRKETTGPLVINHSGQFPSVTISFNLSQNVSLGDAVQKVNQVARDVLPTGIRTEFQGSAQEFQKSLRDLGLLLLFSILVIYIILGILYESFIHPFTILSGLPSAGFGALLTLLIFGDNLGVYAFVGLVMLVGIVKKNAIMQIDFALDAERNEGKSPRDAIYEGCLVRFRPIMMTTMAALLGIFPLAVGAEIRRPLGLVVVGGLLFSQLITLYLTPVVYTYMDQFQNRMKKFPIFGRGTPEQNNPGGN